MSKRFTDTEIWDKEWFMKLTPKHKCLIRYLFDKCDVAGVWSPNWVLASAYIGEPVDEEDLKIFNGQLYRLEDGKYFIPDFIEFQYGQLSENCKPHLKIISLLKKYNLYERVCIPYTKGNHTLQEKEEDKDKEKETDKTEKGSGEKPIRRSKLFSSDKEIKEMKAEYEKIAKALANKEIKQIWIEIKEFIETKHPEFIEPYIDAWNIIAQRHNLAKVDGPSDERVRKFKSRIREPMFDYIKILSIINKSGYLQGKVTDWKIYFDWIFKNESNYLKIIEGNYN